MFSNCDLSGKFPCRNKKIIMIADKECPNCSEQLDVLKNKLKKGYELEVIYQDNKKYNEYKQKYNIEYFPAYIFNNKKCRLDGNPDKFSLDCGDEVVDIQGE